MPELPEVETVRRGVEPHVLGRRIVAVTVRDARLRWPVPADFAAFARGQRIDAVSRRGKYLIFALNGGDRIIVHLGMTGRVLVLDSDHPVVKHDHLDLQLDNGRLLRYHDPRRFGAVLPWPKAEAGHVLIDALGPEPLSDAFSGNHLYRCSRNKKAAVKTFVMDGQIVVGAGNIYAAESLFRAGIRPTRAAGRVSRVEYARLADAIRAVLAEAITQGGTTLRDFAGADGASGYFQQDLYVYGREGQPCRVCGTEIKGIRLGNRASCWCPGCQR
ncbi:bifunctional DNA-formamidopyrimidine glycosylase/DNA-(apurinic or apyrimidinic site) lyase [Nevskia sp.]|uniref:bifunctional DNA-formamidopyrimidine glycosylase/DNA-(apurinic or apyrimidinic site) lyase n=1 Tax=Nevskia sp. TaxID=1929292 RepID=UPI0025FCDDD4|nr:bifunctional DNA-formamidopyrimidine glycosylase/DNA-(apurinic or apyrimidinic site) lyase [Nevskia sp.]